MLDTILTLARIFEDHGKQLYMVGGTVRDLLLRRESSPDIDLTTNARPDDIKRMVALTHPAAVVTVGEQFGTVRIHYARPEAAQEHEPPAGPAPAGLQGHGESNVDVIEITTYRSDQYNPESRKPEVTFGDSLEEDLLRRDFTINAMARDPLTGTIIDPFGGRDDLEVRLIRAVGNDPRARFAEDPLRMLRAARFAAQLDFMLEPATAAAIVEQAETLTKISKERIRDEFTKLLVTPNPALGLRLLVDLGLMPYIVPEVLELRGVSQKPAHSKDVYSHVLRVVERMPATPAGRWGALLHDIAKPRTKSVEDGKVHFFGHEDVGAVMARDILRRLKFDKPFIEYVSRLVRLHMRVNAYTSEWTDGAVRRLMLDTGAGLMDQLDLSRADITSYRPEKVSRAVARINELQARAEWLRAEAERVPIKSPLDGNDLMELFGREPGPWLRPLKDHLLSLVIDGDLAPDDREGAAAEARRYLAELEHTPVPKPPSPGENEPATAAAEDATAAEKRAARAAARRQSRQSATPPSQQSQAPDARRDAPQVSTRASARAPRQPSNPMRPASGTVPAETDPPPANNTTPAARDAIVAFLNDYLQIGRFRDLAPNGMQVIGKGEVRRVATGVSAHVELFERAIAWGADMIVVHHGLFLERDPRVIDARLKRRLKPLFDADVTLLGYHLPLDAHPEIGNNAQWLRRLGFAVESRDFGEYLGQPIGVVGLYEGEGGMSLDALVRRVAELAGAQPRVYAYGPRTIHRLAVNTGGAPASLAEAVSRGCEAYLTGETAEGTQALAREDQANFIAAGHYNSERFGIQAIGELLAERFGVETRFIEVPNDV